MSNHQYFFAISTGCLDIYENNSRSEFKNTLKKTITPSSSQNQSLSIAVDTIIFDNTFKKFSGSKFCLAVSSNSQNTLLELTEIDSISSLVHRLNIFFITAAKKSGIKENIGLVEKLGNKIKLDLYNGLVIISPEFIEFLSLKETLEEQIIRKDGEELVYYKLKKADDGPISITSGDIKLNENYPEYINICCENIERFPNNSVIQNNIICSIPMNKHQPSTFYSPAFRNFFKVNSSKIETLQVKFCQPNGTKVYFEDGAPNILKMAVSSLSKNDFFYIQVSSAVSTNFPDNTTSSFQVELPKEYQLPGHWQVGVTNVYIPKPSRLITFDNTIYTIAPGQNYFIASCVSVHENKTKYEKFPLLEFSKRELCIFLMNNFHEFFSVFIDQNENIFLTCKPEYENNIQIFSSNTILNIINVGGYMRDLSNTAVAAIWRDRLVNERIRFTLDHMAADNLGGLIIQKTLGQIKAENNVNLFYFDCRVFYNINKMLDEDIAYFDIHRLLALNNSEFLKREEVRLLQYIQSQQVLNPTQELIPSFFFIYADFVSETVMADKFYNILKMVPYRGGFNNLPGGLFDFPRCEFFNVNKHYIKNIKFDVRTHSGNPYMYFPEDENIFITLKFQRVS